MSKSFTSLPFISLNWIKKETFFEFLKLITQMNEVNKNPQEIWTAINNKYQTNVNDLIQQRSS